MSLYLYLIISYERAIMEKGPYSKWKHFWTSLFKTGCKININVIRKKYNNKMENNKKIKIKYLRKRKD